MGTLLILLFGLIAAGGIGVAYNSAATSIIDDYQEQVRRPHFAPASSTTPTPVTSLRISLSETFDRRAAELSRIVQRSNEVNRDGRPAGIWRIDPESATDNYNGATQSAIHHFIPGDLLRDTFYRELNRPANEWRYLIRMLKVAVESLQAAPYNQRSVSNYELRVANWTLDLFDERVRSTETSIYNYEFIYGGLDTLYEVFYWSSFNLFIGPLPQQRQPADQGNKLDVQLTPVMTLERSNKLRNLFDYFARQTNLDNSAVTDYISLTSVYRVPTSSGPWMPLPRTLDDYFRELVRISRLQNQAPVSDAVDYLSENKHLMMGIAEQFQSEVIDALKACDRCKNAINSMENHDCKKKKCPFFIKKVNTYYILDAWPVMRTWINFLLGKKEGVTPRFSLPDDVTKNYFDCDNDKDDGSGSCPNFSSQIQNDDVTQAIEHYDKAFKKQNPDIEYTTMKHLPNRYLQPFGNPLIMSSLTPIVVNCLVLLHNQPLRSGIVNTRNRRRRYRVNENDIDVKYNSQYLLKLVELIHQDMNKSVDELSIFKQLVTDSNSPNVQSSFNRVCNNVNTHDGNDLLE